jgi:hypothetical protein
MKKMALLVLTMGLFGFNGWASSCTDFDSAIRILKSIDKNVTSGSQYTVNGVTIVLGGSSGGAITASGMTACVRGGGGSVSISVKMPNNQQKLVTATVRLKKTARGIVWTYQDIDTKEVHQGMI